MIQKILSHLNKTPCMHLPDTNQIESPLSSKAKPILNGSFWKFDKKEGEYEPLLQELKFFTNHVSISKLVTQRILG